MVDFRKRGLGLGFSSSIQMKFNLIFHLFCFKCSSYVQPNSCINSLMHSFDEEMRDTIPVRLRRVRNTRSLTHLHPSKFHYLTDEIYPTNHHSCRERGSSWLFPFLNPTNLKSLRVFHFLVSSFIGALYRPPWPFPNITC